MTSARETYESLQAGMKLLADLHGAAAYGMPEYQAAWRASENLKNQNGGMPPEKHEHNRNHPACRVAGSDGGR